jgi:hypothetical protein
MIMVVMVVIVIMVVVMSMVVIMIVIVMMVPMIVVMRMIMIVVVITFITALVVFVVFFHQEGDLGSHVNVLQRQVVCLGNFHAGIVFGSEYRWFVRPPAEFSLDRTKIGFDRIHHSLTNGSFDKLAADPKRVRFVKQDRFQDVNVFRLAKDTQDDSRPILFHLDRRRVNVQRSGSHQRSSRVTDHFARNVIQICFQQHHGVGGARRRRSIADQHSHHVGSIFEVACSGSMSDSGDRHLRQTVGESVDDGFDDGGSRGSCQFRFDRNIAQRDSFQQFGGSRRWDLADAMSDLNLSASRWN